jgi:GntR family transcriptional regulator
VIDDRANAPRSSTLDARTLAAAIHARGGTPLHSRLETTLRRLIEQGQISTGAVLPGELELAAQLGVSRHTVRHALGVLTTEGLLRRERGRGTTVVSLPPRVIERSLGSFYAFAWETRARGASQRSYVLERRTISADDALAERLELPRGTPVEHILRLRTADEDPLIVESAYLPLALSQALDAQTLELESIYDELERRCGVRITRARELIRPVLLTRHVARLLRATTGAPAFQVERTTWSEAGPIEWQESIVRGDRYLYSVDLPRRA